MKTKCILTTAALSLLLAACNVQEADLALDSPVLTARLEGPETRVSFDHDVDGKMTWNAGDQIAVHVGSGYSTAEITPTSGHFTVTETASSMRNYYAVYPSSVADASNYGNTTLKVTLPATYDISDIVAGTTTTRGTEFAPLPMVAVNNTHESVLMFRHVGGLLRVTCNGVPKGTRYIKVTLDRTITGSFTVNNPASETPTIKAPETSTNNYVVFTVAGSGGLAANTDGIILNVPVPCGTYNSCRVETFSSATATGTPDTYSESGEKLTFARHHGRSLPFGGLSVMFSVTGPSENFAQEGETRPGAYTVKSFKRVNGVNTEVPWTATFYAEDGTQIAKPSWLTGFTTSDAGSLTDEAFGITVTENNSSASAGWKGPTAAGENIDQAHAIDLSLQDIYGNPIAQSTANCYVVSRPGWYKIPCVYGNALKNGETNASSYTSTLTGNDPAGHAYLSNFPRHDGSAITAPWINDNGSITISSALKVWEDSEGIIKSVGYNSANKGYLYFEVSTLIKQANAIVAVKNSDGTILWSWHIWVTEGIDVSNHLNTTAVYSHPTAHHSVTDPNYMMNVDLGWVDSNTLPTPRSVKVKITQDITDGQEAVFTIYQDSKQTFGGNLFYQWGRKDPFPGVDANYNPRPTYGDLPFPEPTGAATNPLPTVGTGYTIGWAIQHPNQFVRGSAWATNMHSNLWNSQGTFRSDVVVVKTVYDPCPVGFKVPNTNAFTGFTTTGGDAAALSNMNVIGVWQPGFLFKRFTNDRDGLFFPAKSVRGADDGKIRPKEYAEPDSWSGHYWMAARTWQNDAGGGHSATSPYYFNFHDGSSRVLGDNANAAYGFSVRPVAE